MRESDLLKAIETYTQKNGKIPTKLCGRFEQLLPIIEFSHYMTFMGREGYKIPLGFIELELDVNAIDWYLT